MKIRILALLMALFAILLFALSCKKEEPESPPDETPSDSNNTPTTGEPQSYAEGSVEGSITWEMFSDGTLYIKGEGEMSDFITGAEEGNNQQPWREYVEGITKVVVENGVTRLAKLSFKNCTKLREVVLGKGITEIPSECFANCYMLKAVTAKSVTVLREFALENCTHLETLTLSASLSKVEHGALSSACTEVQRLTLKLAGTEAEWLTAKEALDFEGKENSEQQLADAMERITFVGK